MTDTFVPMRLVAALLVTLTLGCARSGDRTTSAPPQPEEPITLLYDVRDLIISRVHDFPVVYDEHGWPRADQSPTSAPTREEHVANFIRLITDVVDPPSWHRYEPVREEAGQLIVTQTPRNHAQVKKLIESLRVTRGLQITLTSFVIRGDEVWKEIERTGGNWQVMHESTEVLYLTAEQVRPLVEGRKQDAMGWSFLTAPRMTTFNSQRAHVIVANETPYVCGYAPVNAAFEGRKLEPVMKTVNSGVVIDCRATVAADRRNIKLDLHPRLSTLRDVKSVPWPEAPPDLRDLKIQVPHTTTAGVDVSVSVPDNGWVLFRTVPKHQPPDATAPPAEPVLFAFGATLIPPERD